MSQVQLKEIVSKALQVLQHLIQLVKRKWRRYFESFSFRRRCFFGQYRWSSFVTNVLIEIHSAVGERKLSWSWWLCHGILTAPKSLKRYVTLQGNLKRCVVLGSNYSTSYNVLNGWHFICSQTHEQKLLRKRPTTAFSEVGGPLPPAPFHHVYYLANHPT